MRLRQLALRIKTAEGLFGVTIPFEPGLVVLRADNSTGKSTCIQSVIYALGIEGMLSASQEVPLQYALTEKLDYQGREVRVIESEVLLEVENSAGAVLTLRRPIRDARSNTRLVTVSSGPALSTPGDYEKRDYYVRMEGAAQRPLGLHHMLANFLGWQLPTVSRFDDSECPLYLECVFPLFIIEQKHGWSGIQARLPLHYRIREMGKRATEFVLKLDAYEIALKRQVLRGEATRIQSNWQLVAQEVKTIAERAGAVVRGLPSDVPLSADPLNAITILLPRHDAWTSLAEAVSEDRRRLQELESMEIPRVQEVSSALSEALRTSQTELASLESSAFLLFKEVEIEKRELDAITERISALNEDLKNNQDVLRLRGLGSIASLPSTLGRCPTCDQAITGSLLIQSQSGALMTVEENIAFIRSQLVTFESMRRDTQAVLDAKRQRVRSMQTRVEELRAQIRTQKATLVSDARMPSMAAIQERMSLSNRIRMLDEAQGEIERLRVLLNELCERWVEVQNQIRALSGEELSPQDQRKLEDLESTFKEQVRQYGLGSVPVDELRISPETYRPIHDGFDLGFNLSASDMIRTIWAYLYGLLEVARRHNTNHLGLLILDEPRQQETAAPSFSEFLRRAATARDARQQVIFATSEESSNLRAMLESVPHQYVEFEGKIFSKLE